MNTMEQSLRDSHEAVMVDAPRNSRTPSRTPRRALIRFARRRRWDFLAVAFVMYLGGIAVLVHLLRSALGDPALPLQEFEGLGIVVCALAYIGIFLWRLTFVFEREAQQVEASEKPSEIPSAVVRRMQTGE